MTKYMVGALDSLGVPYTKDNEQVKSFIDLVADQFKQEGILINYVNLCNFARVETFDLQKILRRDYQKGQYYKLVEQLNRRVIETTDNGRFDHPYNPQFLEQYYKHPEYPETKITTELKQQANPTFLYTCGGMNLDHYLKFPTQEKQQIIPELFRMKKHVRQTLLDIRNCLVSIQSLNPTMEIYMLGVYAMIEQKTLREIAQPIYQLYNNQLKQIANELPQVHYINIEGAKQYVAPQDNHPTFKGQCYMADQVLDKMEKNGIVFKKERTYHKKDKS